MKKIEAVIRKSKFKVVKKALVEAGFEFFSYWMVRDVTEEKEKRIYRGVEYETPANERIMMVLVVQDSHLKEATDTIIKNGTTRGAGDGRIFVSTIEDAMRIQTDDNEDIAVPY